MAIKPIKVSQLNGYVKRVLQMDPLLGNVTVIGEISNLKYHGSGHVYFTLKDETSKINCFLPSEYLEKLRYELNDGMEIIVNGYIYLYERGGTYSLNVREITIEGIGNLSIAFEKLKEKLSKEGLFDDKYKKLIPYFPKKIAVITSETGAAVRDIIKIIKSRNTVVDVLIYPCLVQGPDAASDISSSIDAVNRLFPEIDTIIVGRGGGSMEELWAFNEEIVARSIFASRIPIISAVGHETDFTIADFVADKRAETPTAAAQMAVPDVNSLKEYIRDKKKDLNQSMNNMIRLLEMRVTNNSGEHMAQNLKHMISYHLMNTENQYKELKHSMNNRLRDWAVRLEQEKASLDALNPASIMKRGYAAVLDQNKHLTSSVRAFEIGDSFTLMMEDGTIRGNIAEIWRKEHGK